MAFITTKEDLDKFRKALDPRVFEQIKGTMVVHEKNKAIFKDKNHTVKLSMLWDDYITIKSSNV